jgi:hypothetical protein
MQKHPQPIDGDTAARRRHLKAGAACRLFAGVDQQGVISLARVPR